MPSIFTRARTTSTKTLKGQTSPDASHANGASAPFAIDEFGRVTSRGGGGTSGGGGGNTVAPATPAKDKDRRAQTVADRRRVTSNSTVQLGDPEQAGSEGPEDGFLPTNVALPQDGSQEQLEEYGYLGHAVHIVLGIEDVQRLLEVVSEEIIQRGLTTPFLLSNTALDLSSTAIRRLIDAFLRGHDFLEEAQFATPHTLAAVLRWGLARPVRIVSGVEQHGIIAWEQYLRWRHLEHANNFSKTEFTSFIGLLAPLMRSLILTLFSLLARLLANSTSSGLSPPKLASLFGPLLFGIPTTSFHSSYAAYLRSSHALEHLLLSFVRLQIAQTPSSAPPPRRLLSWVQGYPAMLAPIDSFERPRLGAKTRRVASLRRNVRMYSHDLMRTCGSWSRGPDGIAVRESKEWERIAPKKGRNGIDRMEPRYSDAYRKKLDLAPGVHPSTSLFPTSANSSSLSTPSLSATSSTASTKSSLFEDPAEEAKFRSLTDMKWGEFSLFGFGDGSAAPSALQFDLTEGARNQRAAKRATLTWADFSAAGFSRSDASLSTTLQFTEPLSQSVQQWPNEEKEIHRKLKKNLKPLPAFGWDITPVVDGREDLIEEGFLDVFCDILYGGGWIERAETTFRECNWVLVEFRSLPTSRSEANASSPLSLSSMEHSGPQDPRVSTSLVLFEEFVPAEYRFALLNQGNKPSRRIPGFGAFLSPAKKNQKQWQKAQTLNGKPYVVGNVPRNSSSREAEFERILAGTSSATKVLSLNNDAPRRAPTGELSKLTINPSFPGILSTASLNSPNPMSPSQGPPLPNKSLDSPTVARTSSPFRKPRFRLAVGRDSKKGMVPSEYDTVDFETRLASYSDDELNSGNRSSADDANGDEQKKNKMRERRMSKDDAWVDILVASAGKRMGNQDAELRPRKPSNPRNLAISGNLGAGSSGHSDPELASQEVAQALAAVRQHPPTDDEGDGGSDQALRRELEKPVELREPTAEMLRGNENSNGHGHDHDEDDESFLQNEASKKRLGYFDLHPDRRPTPSRPDTGQSQSFEGSSMYSEGSIEPAMMDAEVRSDGDIEVPAFIDDATGRASYGYAKTDSTTLPSSINIETHAHANPQSKTAQLIEMYRERERASHAAGLPADERDRNDDAGPSTSTTTSAIPLPPTAPLSLGPKASRIPVRSSSLEGPSTVPRDVSPEPESSEFDAEEADASAIASAAPFMANDRGRQSPGRYVHGAPLHNVVEEEEE